MKIQHFSPITVDTIKLTLPHIIMEVKNQSLQQYLAFKYSRVPAISVSLPFSGDFPDQIP